MSPLFILSPPENPTGTDELALQTAQAQRQSKNNEGARICKNSISLTRKESVRFIARPAGELCSSGDVSC